MNQRSQTPNIFGFLMMGVFIVMIIAGIFVVSYLLIWGAVIGLVLFVIAFIRSKFFPSKTQQTSQHQPQVYDHDEFK